MCAYSFVYSNENKCVSLCICFISKICTTGNVTSFIIGNNDSKLKSEKNVQFRKMKE